MVKEFLVDMDVVEIYSLAVKEVRVSDVVVVVVVASGR